MEIKQDRKETARKQVDRLVIAAAMMRPDTRTLGMDALDMGAGRSGGAIRAGMPAGQYVILTARTRNAVHSCRRCGS